MVPGHVPAWMILPREAASSKGAGRSCPAGLSMKLLSGLALLTGRTRSVSVAHCPHSSVLTVKACSIPLDEQNKSAHSSAQRYLGYVQLEVINEGHQQAPIHFSPSINISSRSRLSWVSCSLTAAMLTRLHAPGPLWTFLRRSRCCCCSRPHSSFALLESQPQCSHLGSLFTGKGDPRRAGAFR